MPSQSLSATGTSIKAVVSSRVDARRRRAGIHWLAIVKKRRVDTEEQWAVAE
jgi:hypothetical protein